MSFSNPAFLFGLLGAAIPILIHLINRKKPRKVSFAAITFVLRSVERTSRKLRIRKFLLLAARVLILSFFAFAAARPFFGESGDQPTTVTHGPERVGIIVDVSLSMRATFGDESAFDRARESARTIVDRLGPEDVATIVAAKRVPEALVKTPTGERSELSRVLSALEPSHDAAELSEAITLTAKELLRGASVESPARRRIVVLADMAGHGIRASAELQGASLELIDVLTDVPAKTRANHALTDLSVSPARGRGARSMEVRARVRAFASESGPATPVAATMSGPDGELVPSTLDLIPGTTQDKSFVYTFEDSGVVPISVALTPDVLADDDVRHEIAHVEKQVRVLIVDGAPSGVPKEDEIFYLERALLLASDSLAPPAVVTADDFGQSDLFVYDVVILAGISAVTSEDAQRLAAFVEKGGGLFVSMASGVDVDSYNRYLGKLLPRVIRGEKKVQDVAGSAPSLGMRIGDATHPVTLPFAGDAKAGLETTETSGYFLLDPAADDQAQTILVFDDNQPALMGRSVGEGKVFLLTTSIDRDLTDLPIRPAFVPLLERSLAYLANALTRPDDRRTLVGDVRALVVPDDVLAVEIQGPDKQVERLVRLPGASSLRFEKTRLPGAYQVSWVRSGGTDRVPREDFAVNVDPLESDLRPLSTDEASAILKGGQTPQGGDARFRNLAGASTRDIASILVLLMFLAFVGESALSASKENRR